MRIAASGSTSFHFASELDAPGYRALFEWATDAIFVADANGRPIDANEAACALLGRTREELIGLHVSDVVAPAQHARLQLVRRRLLAGESATAEWALRHRDGHLIPVEVSSRMLPDGRWCAFVRDLRPRHRLLSGQQVLARAGHVLASPADTLTTLRDIAELLVEYMAEGCAVDLVRPDGSLERAVLRTRDPEKAALAEELERRYPTPPDSTAGNVTAARTGETQIYPYMPDDLLAAASLDEEHLHLWRRLAMTSALCVPLKARGRTLGVITLVSHDGVRRFDELDAHIVQELAQRAALALDNARLFAAMEQELAQRRAAEAERNRTERLLRLLAESGRVLSASLDAERTLHDLALLVTGTMADVAQSYVIDPEGRIRTMGATAASEALHRSLEEVHDDGGDEHAVSRVIRTGESLLVDGVSVQAAAAEPLACSSIIVPLRGRERVLGAFAVSTRAGGHEPLRARDVPYLEQLAARAGLALENAQLFDAERRARDDAEQASRAKSQFLAVMSHELRTPLTGIIGYADLLASGAWGVLNDVQAGKVSRIKTGAWHLVSVIDEILTFARTEVGRELPRPAPVDLVGIAEVSAQLVSPQAEAKGLAVHIVLPDTPVVVNTDAAKVRQILLNLLGNAVKFTELGEVALTLRGDEGHVRVRVRDTGPGIPFDKLASIFDPFTQVDSSNTRSKGGTGLGLAVSRRLARLLGGDVTVRSQPGTGAEFTLVLPRGGTFPGAI